MTTIEEIKKAIIGKTIRLGAGGHEYGFIMGARTFVGSSAIATGREKVIIDFSSTSGMLSSMFASDFNNRFEYWDGHNWNKLPNSYFYIPMIIHGTAALYYNFRWDEV